jgi:hypothetical protein
LQPLDLTVNSVFKKQQRDSFLSWYAQDLKTKLDGLNVGDVKMCLRLSFVKPLHAEWVITTMLTLKKKKKEVGSKDSDLLEFWTVSKQFWPTCSL